VKVVARIKEGLEEMKEAGKSGRMCKLKKTSFAANQ